MRPGEVGGQAFPRDLNREEKHTCSSSPCSERDKSSHPSCHWGLSFCGPGPWLRIAAHGESKGPAHPFDTLVAKMLMEPWWYQIGASSIGPTSKFQCLNEKCSGKRGGRSCKYPKGFTSETASRTDHRALGLQYRVHSSAVRVKVKTRVIDHFHAS